MISPVPRSPARTFAVLGLVVVALVLPHATTPARAQDRQALAGTTVVQGSDTAVTPVHIPVPVTLSAISSFSAEEQVADPNPDVAITGTGRVSGIVLTQNGSERRNPASDNDGATLYAARYGMCMGAACEPVRAGVSAITAFGPGVEHSGAIGSTEQYRLPAGDYNLYLLSDGAPVTVTLTLHGLVGSTTITPAMPAGVGLSEASSTDGVTYAAEAQVEFGGLGMIAVASLTRSEEASVPMGGFCIVKQNQEPSPTDRLDGTTFCTSRVPASTIRQHTGDFSDNFHGATPGSAFVASGDYPSGTVRLYSSFDPGVYRVSQSYVTTPLDNSRGFVVLWVPWV